MERIDASPDPRSAARAEALFESAPVAAIEGTLDGTIVRVNRALGALLGHDPAALVGTDVRLLVVPGDRDHLEEDIARLAAGVGYTAERRYLAADGRHVPVLVHTTVLGDPADPDCRVAAFSADLTAVHAQRDALRTAHGLLADAHDELLRRTALLEAVLAAIDVGIGVADAGGRLTLFNRAMREIHGQDADSGIDTTAWAARYDLFHADGVTPMAADEVPLARALREGEAVEHEMVVHPEGRGARLYRATAHPMRGADGTQLGAVVAMADITAVVEAERRLAHSALHDVLTGLPNRLLLTQRLTEVIDRAEAGDRRLVALLFCDLDGFKGVNDGAGHAVGDQVLVRTAERLRQVLAANETVARVGGDEFVLVVDRPIGALPAAEAAADLGRLLVAAVRTPVRHDDGDHVVTASIGVRLLDDLIGTPDGVDTALQDADAAMYAAKAGGRNRVEVFHPSMRRRTAERVRVERVLRESLAGATDATHQLALQYQPIVRADDGRVSSIEALARLTGPDGAQIAPESFIQVAEDTGLITLLGPVVLQTACAQLAAWRTHHPALRDVAMAVNVSALQAADPTFGERVRAALDGCGLRRGDLVLELTETALLQASADAIAALTGLHDEGVGIALDDFGVGYASLRYLSTLPISAVKVDRSFTRGLLTDRTSASIVSAVLALARDLGLDCIVEGVETAEQRAALPGGVHLQGWLIAPPLDGDAVPAAVARLGA